MYFGADLTQIAFIVMVVVAVGGVAIALLFPLIAGSNTQARVKAIAENRKSAPTQKQSAISRLVDGQKDGRRKQIQESLKQIEEREKQRKRRLTLRMLIMQSGIDISTNMFWVVSF